MRIAILLLVLGILQAHAVDAYSQKTRLSLDFTDTELIKVLDNIEVESEFFFLYNEKLLDTDRKVNITANDQLITNILDNLFAGTDVKYSIIDRKIILAPEYLNKETDAVAIMQQQIVTGTVTDSETGDAMPGVNIVVKGTTLGAITDANGKYSFSLPDKNVVLVFSFIGYRNLEITVAGKSVIDAVLVSEALNLEEVVVVGYGTQRKVNITGSVGTIKAEDIAKTKRSNTIQALQGKVSGLTIIDLGGVPGAENISTQIRGITTLGNNAPLILVDGVEQSLSGIPPDQIESFSVLKDAASTAIYGSRAAAGVILVTTKKAAKGEIKVDYSYSYTIQKIGIHAEALGLEDYLNLQKVSYGNNGLDPATYIGNLLKNVSKFNPSDPIYENNIDKIITGYVELNKSDPYKYPNYWPDWFNLYYKDAPMQSHSLSISGGEGSLRGRIFADYLDQQPITVGVRDYKRYTFMGDLIFEQKKLKIDLNFSSRYDMRNDFPIQTEDSGPANPDNITHASLWAIPQFPDGTYGASPQGGNMLVNAKYRGLAQNKTSENIVNVKGIYNIIEGLEWSTQASYKQNDYRNDTFLNKNIFTDELTGRSFYNWSPNSYSLSSSQTRTIDITNLLRYINKWGNHNLTVLLGHNDIQMQYEYLRGSRQNFYNNELRDLDLGANDVSKTNSSDRNSWGLRSFFGRLNYNYNERYLVEMNIRRDGSSRFYGDNQYSFFPSFSVGWKIAKENFWQPLVSKINDFTLRVSWGQTGNQAVGLYAFYPSLSQTSYSFNNKEITGYRLLTDPNQNLKWETTDQINFGTDLRFYGGKMAITFDYFIKTTNGILLPLPIAGIIGLQPNYQNAGSVENKGWELNYQIRSNPTSKLKWDLNFSLFDVKNKILDLAGTGPYFYGERSFRINKVGLPINSLYGFKANGVYLPSDFDVNGVLNPNLPIPKDNLVYPGDLKFEDINGDGRITADGDQAFLGSIFPRYNYGLITNLSYKNFDLSIFFQGVGKANVLLQGALVEGGNWEGLAIPLANDYWTLENQTARFPRPDKKGIKNSIPSSWWVIDASYFKLKNIQIGYTIPNQLLNKIKIDGVYLYASMNNVFFISKSRDWGSDPEIANQNNARLMSYPQTKQITFGAKINF